MKGASEERTHRHSVGGGVIAGPGSIPKCQILAKDIGRQVDAKTVAKLKPPPNRIIDHLRALIKAAGASWG